MHMPLILLEHVMLVTSVKQIQTQGFAYHRVSRCIKHGQFFQAVFQWWPHS